MRISDWSSDVCSSDLVGPGDFMGFTAPSPGHHLVNPYQEDLVYLMGGERSGLEIGRFPRAGKTIIFDGQRMPAVDDGARREMRSEERPVGEECVGTCRYRGSP